MSDKSWKPTEPQTPEQVLRRINVKKSLISNLEAEILVLRQAVARHEAEIERLKKL